MGKNKVYSMNYFIDSQAGIYNFYITFPTENRLITKRTFKAPLELLKKEKI